jgi:phage host-nuclease inhibitor protein Gam
MLRREIWPADQASPVSQMCTKISKAFKKKEHVTKLRIMDYCNVNRDGTHDEFGRAWKAMLTNGIVYVVGKTHKKTDIYTMRQEND